MDVPEFQPGLINQLPSEILEEILKYIPTSDILGSCRLVCHNWYPLATSFCRNRHVKVKNMDEDDSDSGLSLHDIFKRDTDLPWSAVELLFDSCPDMQKFQEQVCENFGANLELLDATVENSQYNNFVGALRKIRSLQKLKITPADTYMLDLTNFAFPLPGAVQLPKLKQLEIEYDPEWQFTDLLEFILVNTGAPMKSLKVRLNEIHEADFNRMANLICASTVEKLSLDASYASGQFSNWNTLMDQLSSRMDELQINLQIRESEIGNGGCFDLLERCLVKCTRLRTLILSNFNRSWDGPVSTSILLQLPTLTQLETLKIVIDYNPFIWQYNQNPDFPVSFNRLMSTDLPNLKSVHLKVGYGDSPMTIDIRKIFQPSYLNPFESVTFLDIGMYQGEGNLHHIFPNLMKITAAVMDSKYLCPIFENMINLIEVDLTLYSYSDNNALFSKAVGFIRNFKKLKMLTVRNYIFPSVIHLISGPEPAGELNDLGLSVLILIHPVNLKIYGAKVKETDEIVALLRTRHPQLQLL